MPLNIPFDNTYARLPPQFFTRQVATPVSAPRLIVWNDALAGELGVSGGDAVEKAAVFGGNALPDGAAPLAQVYAGHQFGGFSPQLGDGRALLLGEVVNRSGQRRDIQLKGSGPTPYSRRGDGRSWLGPVLREYILSEIMHAAGIASTRALAAVATGDTVYRDRPLPGGVMARVADSHIRVGSFQYFAARQDYDAVRRLYEYTRARHYPDAGSPLEMLQQVIARQARLVASWGALGFIHGVMNTDNTSLSGETIDYGPAAFMDVYHPQTVYSSIDRQGRYAYDNQSQIIVWNMAQLASCLVVLEDDAEGALAPYTAAVHAMPELIAAEWRRAFGRKIGLADAGADDAALITDLLDRMTAGRADFTNTFAAMADGKPRDQFSDPALFDAWEGAWRQRLQAEPEPQAVMRAANPLMIPRNHLVEQVIVAAVNGDEAPFHALLAAALHPYDTPPEAFTRPPEPHEEVEATFCGT